MTEKKSEFCISPFIWCTLIPNCVCGCSVHMCIQITDIGFTGIILDAFFNPLPLSFWSKGIQNKNKTCKVQQYKDKNCLLFCSYKSKQIKQKFVILCSFRLMAYSVADFSCDKQWQTHPPTVRWLLIDMAAAFI